MIKAIVLALLVQTDKNNELEKFTMYNVAKMLSNLGGNTDQNDNNLLDVYFKNLPANHIAKDAYAQSNFQLETREVPFLRLRWENYRSF